ncbi:MAG: hypothetical protein OEL76_17105, partial [Siculibacillus sp.]|nr:hypothetical protein [Siculibacillus sp.]
QMAGVPGLSPRGSIRQFRVRVPGELRKTIGKGEIVKSLGTVSEAARLARIERPEADRAEKHRNRLRRISIVVICNRIHVHRRHVAVTPLAPWRGKHRRRIGSKPWLH